MGCWNATCALSGLPITYKEPVKFILLTPGRSQLNVVECPPGETEWIGAQAEGLTYPEDLWQPVAWPVNGLYDDYGLVEDVDVPALAMFRLRLSEVRGKNPGSAPFFTDFPDHLNRDSGLGRDLYGGCLEHRTAFLGYGPLGHTFVRRDVWQSILEIPEGSVEAYRRLTKDFIDELLTSFETLPKAPVGDRSLAVCRWALSWISRADEYPSPAVRAVRTSSPWFVSFLTNAVEDLCGLAPVSWPTRLELYQVGEQVADLAHVRSVMKALRKAWMPGTSRGSQDTSWDIHEKWNLRMSEIARERLKNEEEDE